MLFDLINLVNIELGYEAFYAVILGSDQGRDFLEKDEEQKNEENQNENNQDSTEGSDANNETNENQEQDESENQSMSETDLDVNEFRMEEKLFDTESDKQSSENVIQKLNTTISDKEYKIFTKEFDEIEKAEKLLIIIGSGPFSTQLL